MKTENPTLAARFVFRNCTISLHLPGEMRISRNVNPGPYDIVLNRDFVPAGAPCEFRCDDSDFHRFLEGTSASPWSLTKKMMAIGYMLCNKLPRGGRRCRAFICANEDKGSYCNGKSLFTKAVAQLCISSFAMGALCKFPFWLSDVTNDTELFIIDGLPLNFDWTTLFMLCTNDWIIERKAQSPEIIDIRTAPYVLATTQLSANQLPIDGSFRRRFTALDFSSFFNEENRVEDFLGHQLFDDWDKTQWHMFDNLMFYCVLEYLRSYNQGEDVFMLYV